MAYIPTLDDEEQQQQQPAAAPLPGAPAPVGPVSQQPQAQQPAHSNFVNFSRYLNANRDSAQTTANQLAGDVQKQSDQTQQSTLQAYRTFQQQANAQKPVQYVAPPQNVAVRPPAGYKPQNMAAGAAQAYSGPQALSDSAGWSDLQKQAGDLQMRANLYDTPSGLGAALQERNAGQYGAGARRFDQALVGNVGADQFAGLHDRYGKLSDYLSQADASSRAAAAAKTSEFSTAAGGFKDAQAAADKEKAAVDSRHGAEVEAMRQEEAQLAQDTRTVNELLQAGRVKEAADLQAKIQAKQADPEFRRRRVAAAASPYGYAGKKP